MDTNTLEYFLQLSKTEHMSQTADFFNIGQSTLSKSIANLEAELGLKLFDRVGRHIKLNANGRRFAEYVQESLDILKAGTYTARALKDDADGRVNLGMYTYFGVIQPYVIEYMKMHPGVDFMVYNANTIGSDNSDKDVIIYSSREGNPEKNRAQFWVSVNLFREEMVLAAAPELVDVPEEEDTIDLSLLKDAKFIVMKRRDEVFYTDITFKACSHAGFYPQTFTDHGSLLDKAKYIESGTAVTLIPECCIEDFRKGAPNARFFKIAGFDSTRTIAAMRRPRSAMTEEAYRFWEYLLKCFNVSE